VEPTSIAPQQWLSGKLAILLSLCVFPMSRDIKTHDSPTITSVDPREHRGLGFEALCPHLKHTMTMINQHPWWKDAVVYQIYPASFKDSNGDGIGDIPGIILELDYIKSLGVDVIWICPMYDSPQVDMGYDISDYESVYPPYGTLSDMESLISECHARGLRIILDLVINHTSHLHRWFLESRSSRNNPKRDWYIWRPAKYDANGSRKPPNNWRSNFGGSAWEWDETTQEYYLHLFCPEQPDLNWENPVTRAAIYNTAIEFWLVKGVDGFRVDTVNMYSKQPEFPDAPVSDASDEFQFAAHLFCNGPRMHEYLSEMNAILERYGAMTVGELPHTSSMGKVLRYVSARQKQLNMVFQFDVVDVGFGSGVKYDTTPRNWCLWEFKSAISRTQGLIEGTDAWTTAFLENHDQARSISRFGSDETPHFRDLSGKMLALMLATLSGTLYLYQGQEIGMVNVPTSWPISEYRDVESSNYYAYVWGKTGGDPAALRHAKLALQYLARDHARVPMQWDGSYQSGFTSSDKPWMRINDSYIDINVKRQALDRNSVLSFWKQMLQLRKEYADIFVHGIYRTLDEDDPHVFTFRKTTPRRTAVTILNFSDRCQSYKKNPAGSLGNAKRLAGNYEDEVAGQLRPFEACVYLIGNRSSGQTARSEDG
jgi:oligo-1,6-glucosidase